MTISLLAMFCGIVLLGAVVQGISGFAFSMVTLMVFPYLFGYTKSLLLASMMAVLANIYNVYLYRKNIDWTWIPRWFAVYVPADLVSVLVLKKVGDHPIWYTLMGVIFIAMAVFLLWGQKVLHVKAGHGSLIVLALLSGLIMGAFGVGGPLVAAFFLQATRSKEDYLGTMQVVGALNMAIDVIMRVANGMFTVDLLGYTAIGLLIMVCGLLIAKRLVSHMDALTLRRFICMVIIIDGVVMLFHNV